MDFQVLAAICLAVAIVASASVWCGCLVRGAGIERRGWSLFAGN
jgi:hypothetical protein